VSQSCTKRETKKKNGNKARQILHGKNLLRRHRRVRKARRHRHDLEPCTRRKGRERIPRQPPSWLVDPEKSSSTSPKKKPPKNPPPPSEEKGKIRGIVLKKGRKCGNRKSTCLRGNETKSVCDQRSGDPKGSRGEPFSVERKRGNTGPRGKATGPQEPSRLAATARPSWISREGQVASGKG